MDTYQTIINHRTVRDFKNVEIEEEKMNLLFEAFRRAPSSNAMQQSSIIWVKNQDVKDEIAKIANQDYLAKVPVLLIYLVDLLRNRKIAEEKGFKLDNSASMDKFLQGFTDAVIGAQNLALAGESMGLGTVYFGSVLNDPDRLVELLKLPKFTFPVVGMGLGYPEKDSGLKPRMEMKDRLFIDEYSLSTSYEDDLANFNSELVNYYDLREKGKRSDDFFGLVEKFFSRVNDKRANILRTVKKQGFENLEV